jgi:hypothetical protein
MDLFFYYQDLAGLSPSQYTHIRILSYVKVAIRKDVCGARLEMSIPNFHRAPSPSFIRDSAEAYTRPCSVLAQAFIAV